VRVRVRVCVYSVRACIYIYMCVCVCVLMCVSARIVPTHTLARVVRVRRVDSRMRSSPNAPMNVTGAVAHHHDAHSHGSGGHGSGGHGSAMSSVSKFCASLRGTKQHRRMKAARLAVVRAAQRRPESARVSTTHGMVMHAPQSHATTATVTTTTVRLVRARGGTQTGRSGRLPSASARGLAIKTRAEADDVDWSQEMMDGDDGEFVVEAFDTEDELAQALCLEVEENARGCLEERGAFTMAIPGGSVAKALVGLREVKDIDWKKVHVFFVNERPMEGKCVSLAKKTWTDAVGIPDVNLHAVMATEDLQAAASDYEDQMRQLGENILPIDEENGMPVFDLILLGMGADGHVGSIYPNSEAANDESGACVVAVDKPGKQSVTMTMPLINTADRVVLAATGESKAETVRAALEDDLEWGELPGSMVDAFSTIWFLDMGAASKLSAYEDMDDEDMDDDSD